MAPTTLRELDSRVNDGIHVRLLWSQDDRDLWVTVIDDTAPAAFQVLVRDHERALDVFHHPYAYA